MINVLESVLVSLLVLAAVALILFITFVYAKVKEKRVHTRKLDARRARRASRSNAVLVEEGLARPEPVLMPPPWSSQVSYRFFFLMTTIADRAFFRSRNTEIDRHNRPPTRRTRLRLKTWTGYLG